MHPHSQTQEPVNRGFSLSGKHSAAAQQVIPGGAHTYAKGDDQYPQGMAPIIDHGEGCRVWDIDGNEFLEYGSGLRATTLGHGHPAVVSAVRRWLDQGVNFVRPHRLELEAAERLVELIPCAEMVKFGLNGSDATTAAVKLARAYTGRDLVAVCREHPFLSTDDWFIGTTPMRAGIPESARALTVAFPFNDLAGVEELFEQHRGEIAAVVLEAETVVAPAPGFFAGLRELCDRHGVLMVLDEMITGFRWHERGAQFVHDIRPDLATFGKGIANGFPLSALVGRRDVMRLGGFVEDTDRVFLLSQTAGAQPWALAAMLAVVDLYQAEDITGQLHRTGAALRQGVTEAAAAAGLAEHFVVRGRDCNLVYATLDEHGAPSQELRTLVLQGFVERGILAPSFVVSAAHDQRTVDRTIEVVSEVLVTYRAALEHGIGTQLRGRPVRPTMRARG